MKIYHYTTIEAFCKIWVSKRIKFSDSQRTNDLFEQRKGLPAFNKLMVEKKYDSIIDAAKEFDQLFTQALSSYKQISFVMDYLDDNKEPICAGWQSSMMWGQYAHNGEGVCIELDMKKLQIDDNVYRSPIKYEDAMPLLPAKDIFPCEKEAIYEYIEQNMDTIFFTKHKHWEHENEYRMIKRGDGDMYLPIEGAITSIYVYDVYNINAEIVKSLISNNINLYALWIEKRDEGRVVDKIDYRYYHDVMSGNVILDKPFRINNL